MSDGVAVLAQLLSTNATLLALVPITRMHSGPLPQGVALPAVSIASVSKVDRNLMSPDTYRHVTERVQVTVHASTYPSQKAVLRAVRKAAADKFPTVSGLVNVTVHTDSAGPDFMINETDFESASIYIGSQDFKTTYSEQR